MGEVARQSGDRNGRVGFIFEMSGKDGLSYAIYSDAGYECVSTTFRSEK